MLDLEYLDAHYQLYETTGETIYIGGICSRNRKLSISEILKKIETHSRRYTNRGFSTYWSGASIQDYIVVRQLNDYIETFHWDTYAITFGHLDALITKTPIKVPEGFKKIGGSAVDETIKFVNQVFWLEPYDENDKELMERIEDCRRDLANMLRGKTIGREEIMAMIQG